MNEPDTISWRDIHGELRRRIVGREWLPGELLPTEVELAAYFGCARATVNRAMRELAEAGLVERRRKAGTRVALHPVSRAVLDIPLIRREVEQRNAQWRFSLLSRDILAAPPRIASRLGVGPDTPMLHLTCLHYADHHPFLHEDRWINLSAAPAAETADLASVSANEWLIRNAAYTRGDIAFSALNADADLAELLDADEGAAVFVVDRITWDKSIPVTYVRLSYSPGYRMVTRI